jgi:EAL domain-containing protein (putative c-di-GMP-specific phosphodiesterase class I)
LTGSSASPAQAAVMVAQHSELGIRFSIDDSGTGDSSLSSLPRLHVNKLKMDQSFERDLEKPEEGRVIVRSIILPAHSLCICTISEGAETQGPLAFRRAKNWAEIQGDRWSRP